MKSTYILIILALIGASCAKQSKDLTSADIPVRVGEATEPADETINIPVAEATIEEQSVEIPVPAEKEDTVAVDELASVDELAPEDGESISEDEEAAEPPVVESIEIEKEDDEKLLDQRDVTPEITKPLFPDEVMEPYMIKPGDFLVKIARNEYGDPRKWRDIYNWNIEKIGDNPNLIYPFHFLSLLKPVDVAKNCQLNFSTRKIIRGETLWSIAREVYGNELAWIVLYWDNEEMLDKNEGILNPGSELQVRNQIDPCMANN